MKTCKHPNCKPLQQANENGLCEYHQKELDNLGKEGHWSCSWCEKYKGKEENGR